MFEKLKANTADATTAIKTIGKIINLKIFFLFIPYPKNFLNCKK